MGFYIPETIAETDVIYGQFGGRDGIVPAPRLLGFSKLITVSDTSYLFRLADDGACIKTTSGSATTLTLPPASLVPYRAFARINIIQWGAGQITIAAGEGVTINTPETLKSAKQYATMTLFKFEQADEWLLAGYLEAA